MYLTIFKEIINLFLILISILYSVFLFLDSKFRILLSCFIRYFLRSNIMLFYALFGIFYIYIHYCFWKHISIAVKTNEGSADYWNLKINKNGIFVCQSLSKNHKNGLMLKIVKPYLFLWSFIPSRLTNGFINSVDDYKKLNKCFCQLFDCGKYTCLTFQCNKS